MSTTTATAPAAEDAEATPAGGKKKLVLLGGVVLLVGLAAAAWFLFFSGGSEPEPAPEPGEVVSLEPITMNLADGRLLKVGVALQLPLEGASHGEGEFSGALALDETIALFGGKTYNELVTPEGREAAKAELSARVGERYHGDVLEVYFTDFLMQ